jgi:hypothetical protein
MALGDYDQDGFVDVYVNDGGVFSGTDQENFLWQNQGNDHRWTALKLTGVLSSRTPAGAHAVATTSAGREVHRTLRVGHGFANTDSDILHFGIGDDPAVERLEIRWPSGLTQWLVPPTMETIQAVTETGLRITGTPQVGETVVLEFYGPPGAAILIVLGLSTLEEGAPIAGGLLEVGPPYWFLPVPGLDENGRAEIPIFLENPGLSGVTVHLQALIRGGGARTLAAMATLAID